MTKVPKGDFPHDVAAGANREVWYAGQKKGIAGRRDPRAARSSDPARQGSAPHGVIIGPEAPLVHRRRPERHRARRSRDQGGQGVAAAAGAHALHQPQHRRLRRQGPHLVHRPERHLRPARPDHGRHEGVGRPKGRGPYGITGTPKGDIWFVSLAGSYLANVDLETGAATVYEPPTKDQGARRVWSDSKGRLWISEWNSGNVSVYDPADKSWKQWKLPGEKPRTYAVWVDPDDKVWLADWGATRLCASIPRPRIRELPQ